MIERSVEQLGDGLEQLEQVGIDLEADLGALGGVQRCEGAGCVGVEAVLCAGGGDAGVEGGGGESECGGRVDGASEEVFDESAEREAVLLGECVEDGDEVFVESDAGLDAWNLHFVLKKRS